MAAALRGDGGDLRAGGPGVEGRVGVHGELAKTDLVPTGTNLLPAYGSFAELEAGCEAFCGQVNCRVHRITRRVPADMLAEEAVRLHRVPDSPATASFGVTRKVPVRTAVVSFDGGQYSVPHRPVGQRVWVRVRGVADGEQVVIVHVGPADLEYLARRLRLPHLRRCAPEIIATAKAQRWEPAEALKAVLAEEATRRERSALAARRAAAGFPTGKTFHAWNADASSIPAPTQAVLRTLEWVHRRENLVVWGPCGTGKTSFLEALGSQSPGGLPESLELIPNHEPIAASIPALRSCRPRVPRRTCGAPFTESRPMSASSAPVACPNGHDDTVRLPGVAGGCAGPAQRRRSPRRQATDAAAGRAAAGKRPVVDRAPNNLARGRRPHGRHRGPRCPSSLMASRSPDAAADTSLRDQRRLLQNQMRLSGAQRALFAACSPTMCHLCQHMVEVLRTDDFDRWLRKLKDQVGRLRIVERLDRLAAGQPGDAKPVGQGVWELPGDRVYYLRNGPGVILSQSGGDRSTPQRDIEWAHQLAEDYRNEERTDHDQEPQVRAIQC